MSEEWSDEHLNKMEACSHLLPDPGGEVVHQLISRIRELETQVATQRELLNEFEDKLNAADAEVTRLKRNLELANESVGEWADIAEAAEAKLKSLDDLCYHNSFGTAEGLVVAVEDVQAILKEGGI